MIADDRRAVRRICGSPARSRVGGVAFTWRWCCRLNILLGRLMTQINGIMRNIGTMQNSAELIAQPIGLVDAPDASALVVDASRKSASRMSASTMAASRA